MTVHDDAARSVGRWGAREELPPARLLNRWERESARQRRSRLAELDRWLAQRGALREHDATEQADISGAQLHRGSTAPPQD
jgi:hypothetical protein